MGKIVGTAPSQISGSVGLYTYRQTKDGTIVSEKVKAKGVGNGTLRQAMVKLQLANLQHLYSAFKGDLELGFENTPKTMNTRSAFIKANFGMLPVYLTKSAANQGACVVTPVQITRGSLQNINVSFNTNNSAKSSISLGSLNLGNSTTIKDFSEAVIANNMGYQNGDQISCFILTQSTRNYNGVEMPFAEVASYEITLDVNDDDNFVRDLVSATGFSSVSGFLGTAAAVDGVAYVHSRGYGEDMKVSTSFIAVAEATTINAWTGATALETAAQSYGGYKAAKFLETDTVSANTTTADSGNSGSGTGGSDIQG